MFFIKLYKIKLQKTSLKFKLIIGKDNFSLYLSTPEKYGVNSVSAANATKL